MELPYQTYEKVTGKKWTGATAGADGTAGNAGLVYQISI